MTKGANVEDSETPSESSVEYTPGPSAVDITPSQDGGVLKEVKKEGDGKKTPSDGSTVYVHYVGTLTNGEQFDSSRDRGEKFNFVLGKGSVIKAWDIGVATMKKGEISVFTCRSDYAYKETGSKPKIPPNATLIFEIELFDWTEEDLTTKKDGGIIREVIKKGTGYITPKEGSVVDVHLIGRHNGNIFEERDVTFCVGEGSEHGICAGLETALEKFKKGEISLIRLKPKYAFGAQGNPSLNIPANADIEYEVELINFEKTKESWEFDSDEKLEQARFFKEKGTNFFKNGKYKLAKKQYKKIADFLEHETSYEGEKKQERGALMLASHLNQAMCYLKLEDHIQAREQCDKALELDPENEKAFFRRGQANLYLKEAELAKKDFEHVLTLEPNNKAAMNQLIVCNNKIKEQRDKDKQTYGNMFKKFAESDKRKEEAEKRKQPDPMSKPLGEWGKDEKSEEKGRGDKSEQEHNEELDMVGISDEEIKMQMKDLMNNVEML